MIDISLIATTRVMLGMALAWRIPIWSCDAGDAAVAKILVVVFKVGSQGNHGAPHRGKRRDTSLL